MKRRFLLILVALLLTGLTACGTVDDHTDPTSSPAVSAPQDAPSQSENTGDISRKENSVDAGDRQSPETDPDPGLSDPDGSDADGTLPDDQNRDSAQGPDSAASPQKDPQSTSEAGSAAVKDQTEKN